MNLVLRKYSPADVDDCVSVLADAFVSSPLHLSAFGNGRIDQNRRFFRLALRNMFFGQAFVALHDGALCGYIHFRAWPYCLPAPEEIPNAAATLLKSMGEAVPKFIQWFARWCHLDPQEPHVHLGPIGVAPGKQQQGIGTALMRNSSRKGRSVILKPIELKMSRSTKNSASWLSMRKWSSVRPPGTCRDL